MDLREAVEELEWARPDVGVDAAAVDLGPALGGADEGPRVVGELLRAVLGAQQVPIPAPAESRAIDNKPATTRRSSDSHQQVCTRPSDSPPRDEPVSSSARRVHKSILIRFGTGEACLPVSFKAASAEFRLVLPWLVGRYVGLVSLDSPGDLMSATVVRTVAELTEALASSAASIEVDGDIGWMPIISVGPGVRLCGGTLSFSAKDVRLTSDNTLSGITIVTAEHELANLNDTTFPTSVGFTCGGP
jgi:hypothetical protein